MPAPTTARPPAASPARASAAVAAERQRSLTHRAPTRTASWLLALAVLAAVVLLSLAVGSRPIAPVDVWAGLTGTHPDPVVTGVVRDARLPRTVIGLAAGLALGLAGALIQAVTRNPLADPGILGVNAGAAFALALGVAVLGVGDPGDYLWFAFGGALAATVVVYLVGASGRGSASPVRLTLAGVALGAVLTGITSAMLLADPAAFQAMSAWQAGTLADRGWEGVAGVWPFLVAGVLLVVAVAPSLNVVALGDDLAASLGADLVLVRVAAVVAITLLAGGATAVAGPIGFVGLMVPHVARWVVGPDQRWILALTLVLAPALLLAADVLGRVVMRPGELPAGIVTACLGAPVLVVLVRRAGASTL